MPSENEIALAKYRLDRAKELIDDAKKLFGYGSYKSGNNRAYFAIFSSMRAILSLDGVDFKKHSGVIQYFLRTYIKTGIFAKEYSAIILNASEIRNASDYDDFYIASREETEQQIENAQKFYDAVGAYISDKIST